MSGNLLLSFWPFFLALFLLSLLILLRFIDLLLGTRMTGICDKFFSLEYFEKRAELGEGLIVDPAGVAYILKWSGLGKVPTASYLTLYLTVFSLVGISIQALLCAFSAAILPAFFVAALSFFIAFPLLRLGITFASNA